MSEAQSFHQHDYQRPELVCPAGTPAALRAAVDAGADAVYCGLQNETNARRQKIPVNRISAPEDSYAH